MQQFVRFLEWPHKYLIYIPASYAALMLVVYALAVLDSIGGPLLKAHSINSNYFGGGIFKDAGMVFLMASFFALAVWLVVTFAGMFLAAPARRIFGIARVAFFYFC